MIVTQYLQHKLKTQLDFVNLSKTNHFYNPYKHHFKNSDIHPLVQYIYFQIIEFHYNFKGIKYRNY